VTRVEVFDVVYDQLVKISPHRAQRVIHRRLSIVTAPEKRIRWEDLSPNLISLALLGSHHMRSLRTGTPHSSQLLLPSRDDSGHVQGSPCLLAIQRQDMPTGSRNHYELATNMTTHVRHATLQDNGGARRSRGQT
jgi:hypothetical protein